MIKENIVVETDKPKLKVEMQSVSDDDVPKLCASVSALLSVCLSVCLSICVSVCCCRTCLIT